MPILCLLSWPWIIEAKHTPTMRANWSYQDVEDKVWSIPKMTDFWGIGNRMEKRLNSLEIYSIKELANSNPDVLKKELGQAGLRLWFHANGIDESNVHKPYKAKSHGWAIRKFYREIMSSSETSKLSFERWLNRWLSGFDGPERRRQWCLFILDFLSRNKNAPSIPR